MASEHVAVAHGEASERAIRLALLKPNGSSCACSNILITGHSLGGGVSWVATYFIKSDGDLSSANVETVTFAAPSPGDASFVVGSEIAFKLLYFKISLHRDSARVLTWFAELGYRQCSHSQS